MARTHAPVDPECWTVLEMRQCLLDPILKLSGYELEYWKEFEMSHRRECEQCMFYGLENLEIED